MSVSDEQLADIIETMDAVAPSGFSFDDAADLREIVTELQSLRAAAKVRAIREGDGEVEALLDKAQELSNAMVAQGARKQIGALYSQAVTLGHMVKHVRDLRAASPAATGGEKE